eukprot:1083606-Amphidinium_carterae.1
MGKLRARTARATAVSVPQAPAGLRASILRRSSAAVHPRLRRTSSSCSAGWSRVAALTRIHRGAPTSMPGVMGVTNTWAMAAKQCQRQLPSPSACPQLAVRAY